MGPLILDLFSPRPVAIGEQIKFLVQNQQIRQNPTEGERRAQNERYKNMAAGLFHCTKR